MIFLLGFITGGICGIGLEILCESMRGGKNVK